MTVPLDDESGPDLPGAVPQEAASDPVAARRKAMDLLARREYGRRELVARLGKAGFVPEVTEATVSDLSREGLLDDARFAESLLRARAGRGQGPVRIRQELRQRGVEEDVAEQALEASSQDWVELARSVRQKKFGARLPKDFADKARQMRFLEYRGFGHEQIRAAVGGDDD